ncbi:MAG: NADH-quinone oxidoreductase subunit NuoH [Candidatus Zixiibacteriota bacterium]|nr:MAG: NADH-quinone oxidoreductase subunit NuoH [candidate division Zixibacteria bacterium]
MLIPIIIMVVKVLVIFAGLMTCVAYMTYAERKVVAHIQVRKGPLFVGYHGLLQPIADAVKLLFKEDFTLAGCNKIIYNLAPLVTFIPALLAIAVIPVGDQITVAGETTNLMISDLNVGILFIFAVSSLGIYGLVLGGWSANSKYSLLGALRSSAQMISYEVSLGLSVIGVLLLAGTLSLNEIVKAQSGGILDWFIFRQPIGFLLFVTAAIAETNRIPFDLPEAEAELVGGYHTEYAGMKFAMFFMGEYASMITVSALAATLFLGGWSGPILPPVVWFLLKMSFFLFSYIWIRGTLPRFRYDQLMRFGWLVLFPLALLNTMVTALIAIL